MLALLSKLTISENLKQRIVTSLILVLPVLWVIISGGILYSIFIILIVILMSFEWKGLISHSQSESHPIMWQALGIAYVALPNISLLWIRGLPNGLELILWILFTVWATDIGAYFAGRAIGGPKLCPRISPNKTWAGLGGGIVAAAGIGILTVMICGSPHPFILIFITASLAIVAQIGDLFESWVKRFFDVKDSGHLLPGHGGILDRFDGIAAVAPKVAAFLIIEGGSMF